MTLHDAVRPCACGPLLGRRAVLAATGAVGAAGLLAACGGGGGDPMAESTSSADDPVITDLDTLRGEGAVTFDSASGKAIAIALDDGVVAYSAVCTHEGCAVGWDADAAQISCPCHGSRYDPADGTVLNGPAVKPLPTVPVEVDEAAGVLRRA